jgi:hypothetical protein
MRHLVQLLQIRTRDERLPFRRAWSERVSGRGDTCYGFQRAVVLINLDIFMV